MSLTSTSTLNINSSGTVGLGCPHPSTKLTIASPCTYFYQTEPYNYELNNSLGTTTTYSTNSFDGCCKGANEYVDPYLSKIGEIEIDSTYFDKNEITVFKKDSNLIVKLLAYGLEESEIKSYLEDNYLHVIFDSQKDVVDVDFDEDLLFDGVAVQSGRVKIQYYDVYDPESIKLSLDKGVLTISISRRDDFKRKVIKF